jgi:hypothetical protein
MVKKGEPKGKKRGFYGLALDEAERLELEEAGGVEGLDEEIALLRVKLRDIIAAEPERIELYLKMADTIAKVLAEIAVPLGIKALIK